MYEFFSEDALKLPIINSVGFAENKIFTRYGPSKRNFYIIHYIISGRGTYNGKNLEAGQGFIITPDAEAFYAYDDKEPWKYIWFTSYDADIVPFLEMHCAENDVFSYRNKEEALAVAEIIKKQKNNLTSSTQLTELFVRVFNACIRKKKAEVSSSKYHFNYLTKYVDMHLDRPLAVADVCEVLGITQTYLYRIVKSETGLSPKQYIVKRKIRQAKRMLAESNIPISTVAKYVGFDDALSFTKFFKYNVGVSPSAFRSGDM